MTGGLLRLLGAGFGVAALVGGTIGAGILRTPGEVAAHLPDSRWIFAVWLLGAVYALVAAVAVAELGAALPKAGGFYVYARRAFGDRIGFAIGFGDWLGQLAAVAFGAIVTAEYFAALVPAAEPWTTAIAIATVLAFTAIQSRGLAFSAATQNWTSALKAAAFLALVAACFAAKSRNEPTETLAVPVGGAALILAAQSVIYTFDGWYNPIYFTEEDVAPERNLPRSMVTGVLVVAAIYLLLNAAFLYILPLRELAASKLAAADAAARVFGPSGATLITVLSLISIPALMNAVLLQATRILFALSRDGFVPSLAQVSTNGATTGALAASCVVTLAMVLTGTAGRLLAIAGFVYVVNYCSAFLAVFVLRAREPHLARPFRAWGHPYSTGGVLAVSLAFLAGAVISDFTNSLFAAALLLIGVPLRSLTR